MRISVNNSYGGDICSIKFEKDAGCFGYAVKVLGFIETNKVKIQHVYSQGKFVTDEIRFKVPHNIIPTFTSKNFKVWYECECATIFKDTKTPFSFAFEISNNNFGDFHYSNPFELDLNLVGEEDYLKKKEDICRLLLGRMQMPLSPKNLLSSMAKSFRDVNKEIPLVLDQGGSESTLSFIQSKEPVFSPSASSSELSLEQPSVSPPGLDTQFRAQPPVEKLGENQETGGFVEVKIEQSSYYSHCKNPKVNTRDESGVFSREVNDEIQSLIAQFAAEDALKSAKKLQESPGTKNRDNEEEPQKVNYEKLIQEMFEEKCRLESEFNDKLEVIQASTRVPSFRNPNLLEIRSYERTSTVIEAGSTIAHIVCPTLIKGQSYIKIKYQKNVRNTQINIWRQDYEKDNMIDAESIFCVSFDSDSCLEKLFDFKVQGFSLKNFVFEVRYILNISLDDSEISLPISVLGPNSKAYVSPMDV